MEYERHCNSYSKLILLSEDVRALRVNYTAQAVSAMLVFSVVY